MPAFLIIRPSVIRPAFLLGALSAALTSCTVYLRDMVDGSPWKRGYDPTYEDALSEGLPPDQAHRRALLHGQDTHNTIWDRRKKEKKERERCDDDDDNLDVRWD